MEEHENIELRSEKVRSIIVKIPAPLIRSGITVITLILLGLIIVSAYIPYPENIQIETEVISNETGSKAISYIPYEFITKIKKGMLVQIELEGYNSHLFGTVEGYISNVNNEVFKNKGHNFFKVTIDIESPRNKEQIKIKNGLTGLGYIFVSNDSILKYICKNILKN